eukprot:TRINITY_DN8309_c0_g2_i1.p1 TRINITY_DN8309_c0_g2~~TRINITY_DN8309_c0_g2_i1.p1  ORF type:complete len:628 (+),score=131.89 TRINITY_DN8309_c0_g2_i1:67-1884(+)
MISYGLNNDDLGPEKIVYDQYRVFKKFAPRLYKHLTVHPLEWPALSLDWIPEDDCREERGYTLNFLLMGTHAVAPASADAQQATGWEEHKPGAAKAASNHIYNLQCTLPSESDYTFMEIDRKYIGKVTPKQRLYHTGEVNCLAHMPQNSHIVASRGPARGQGSSGSVPVYVHNLDLGKDLHNASSQEILQESTDAAFIKLVGHKAEGFTLSWNKKREGLLASGADDGLVIIWDVEDRVAPSELAKRENIASSSIGNGVHGGRGCQPLSVLTGHEMEVQGVDFHPSHQHLLFSVSDDRCMRIWDTRVADKGSITNVRNAHSSAINCVKVHPFAEHVVATAGKDIVKVWDIRFEKRAEPTMVLRGHTGEITCMDWAPHSETVIATGSTDRTVIVWDIEKHCNRDQYSSGKLDCCPWFNGIWQAPKREAPVVDDMNIPKEVLFVHFGHTAPVTALSWNPNENWFLASASQDNMLHIWKMSNLMRQGGAGGEDSDSDFSSDDAEDLRLEHEMQAMPAQPRDWEVEVEVPPPSAPPLPPTAEIAAAEGRDERDGGTVEGRRPSEVVNESVPLPMPVINNNNDGNANNEGPPPASNNVADQDGVNVNIWGG